MATKKAKKELDTSTEEKIKNAARIVFHKKGFAATRTRDIAAEAGINLALLNYYFRSKEKLFDIIMLETLVGFMKSLVVVFNNEETTLQNKIEAVAAAYIDLLVVQPQLPLFIMSELRNKPNELVENLNGRHLILNSVFAKQYQKEVKAGKIARLDIMQFFMNLMGLMVFPFIASPILKIVGDMNDAQYNKVMAERKKLIPIWMEAIMKAK